LRLDRNPSRHLLSLEGKGENKLENHMVVKIREL
jgi:hypothetical protein